MCDCQYDISLVLPISCQNQAHPELLCLVFTVPLRQGWHILRIKLKKSSPADKIGFNWRKLDKSGENWTKLILTIEGERKGQDF